MEIITIPTPRGERRIGPGEPVLVVAELSGNHNQSYDRAVELVEAAIEAGADAIKLQTYTADTMTIDCDNDYFQVKVNPVWAGRTLYNLYEMAHTPWEWQPKLKAHAEAKGVPLFSTPFDATSIEFLEEMGVTLYKVASFEVGDISLLRRIGATRKPVILSRGMATVEEIELALHTLREAGAMKIALLHCVSSYPAVPSQMNLRTIPDLLRRFDVVPGLSDHTRGTAVALASVALGACIIEKHLVLRRADGGLDAAFSLEPHELRELVDDVRDVSAALGNPSYEADGKEAESRVFRRSLFVVADIAAGEVFTERNVRVIRPGFGMAPQYLDLVLGKKAAVKIARGMPLSPELISGSETLE